MGTNFTDIATNDPVTATTVNDRLDELDVALASVVADVAALKILQVVTATYGTQTANTTITPADTGLAVAITPSSVNSKVLVVVFQNVWSSAAALGVDAWLLRDAVVLLKFGHAIGFTQHASAQSDDNMNQAGSVYLDSPASVSALTYKTQFACDSVTQTAYVQQGGGMSTILAAEVKP